MTIKSVLEGTTSFHDYSILDENGVAPTSITTLRYRLSSGSSILIDWTNISSLAVSGVVEIPYDKNIMANPTDINRFITIWATIGTKRISGEIKYILTPATGISPTDIT